jgi:hypothetical protein
MEQASVPFLRALPSFFEGAVHQPSRVGTTVSRS